MLIPTQHIIDKDKKNELILYANDLGAKAIYSDRFKGMAIETNNGEIARKIKNKIKELEKN